MKTPETMNLARQMRELVQLYLVRQRRYAHEQGLPPQGRMLMLLQKNGPLTQAEFGRVVGLEKSWVSRMLDRMVADGWVERMPLESDRRCLQLHLTPAGLELAGRVDTQLTGHAESLLAGLAEADQAQLAAALAPLIDALRTAAGTVEAR
ncbi:MarR family winged helix-turn-helix transcriptional regulator [Uliginosibacterium flavum]|uniref:MarR family transcriptional regulator n=1 Tax=Uliginosibacterium flavum TaxID=1396831 RepID=A0ABV2THK7_9RHOO